MKLASRGPGRSISNLVLTGCLVVVALMPQFASAVQESSWRPSGTAFLVVDISSVELTSLRGITAGADGHVPYAAFLEGLGPDAMAFNLYFPEEVGRLLAARGLRHDAPIYLTGGDEEIADMAVELLREHGFERAAAMLR